MNNEIYIVRHGESENNVLRIECCKLKDKDMYGLTEKGKAATQKEAEKYRDFDIIISSPFRRTMETAAFFAETSEVKIVEDERLAEWDTGDRHLKSYDEVDIKEASLKDDEPFPNGESKNQALARVMELFEEVKKEHQGKKVLIVTHGFGVEGLLERLEEGFEWESHGKEYNEGRRPYLIK